MQYIPKKVILEEHQSVNIPENATAIKFKEEIRYAGGIFPCVFRIVTWLEPR